MKALQTSTEHSRNLDVLRALAVLFVVASHAAHAFWHAEWLGSLGRFGVILFFFHTALVLMQSLDRMGRSAKGWRLAGSFWVRRGFRIYPLAILCVLVALGLHMSPNGDMWHVSHRWKVALANLLLVQNLTFAEDVLGPLWSLPLEVQMYLLLPGIFLLIRRWQMPPLLLWIASLGAALLLPPLSGRFGIFRFAPCFAAGVYAFQAESEARRRLPAYLWLVAIALAALLYKPFDDIELNLKLPLAWLAALVVGGSFLYIKDAGHTWLTRAAHGLAEISYGVYLSHIFVIALCLRSFHSRTVQVAVFIALTPLLSALLYRTIERPGIAMGRLLSRYVERPDTRRAAEAA